MKLYTEPSFVPFLSYTAVPSTFVRSDQISRLVRGGAGHGPLQSSVHDVLPLFDGAPRLRLAELDESFRPASRPRGAAASS